jgi:hypothetical protein
MKRIIFLIVVSVCLVAVFITADFAAAQENLVAMHKSTSSQFNPNCLAIGCHDRMLDDEQSLDPRFAAIHNKMIPYVPGYNPRKGVSDTTCRHCHRSVDLISKSASTLQKNVSPQICVVCHTVAGPGILLFR